MLSYQHGFHAGNLADVHKHGALAWVLDYLTQKDKPLSYLETHSGRALYQLDSHEALQTGEAAAGILRPEVADWFPSSHPYARVLASVRAERGPSWYPGSPWIAKTLLRSMDRMHFAELHPREVALLEQTLGHQAHVAQEDGYRLANALCPPTPRRGVLLIDPSYEVKAEYPSIPPFLQRLAAKWNVGILILWYPILRSGQHDTMIRALSQLFPAALNHRVDFPAAREGHGMVGSGLFVVNPPFGLDAELHRIGSRFEALAC